MPGKRALYLFAFATVICSSAVVGQSNKEKPAPLVRAYIGPEGARGTPPAFPTQPLPVRPPIPGPINIPVRIRFPALVRASGMVFSGTVKHIERRPATADRAVETAAITFHIDQAIRGVTSGEDLTISQWIGLWSSGQRYRIGEHVLLFLYPPSKLGLTSCIAGPMGRFELDAQGRVLLSAQHLAAFRSDPVVGGKSRVRLSDFASAVRRASEEE